jgi:hypothetical protein
VSSKQTKEVDDKRNKRVSELSSTFRLSEKESKRKDPNWKSVRFDKAIVNELMIDIDNKLSTPLRELTHEE